jgi:hypothetical protein
MKIDLRALGRNLLKEKLAATLLSVALFGCAGYVAQTVRGVTEVAATAVYQSGQVTVPQMTQFATDLKGYPNTPLSPSDNQLVANLISQLTRQKAASVTGGSAVDALNNAITALSSTQRSTPTVLTGVNWAYVQQVALGIDDSVNFITNSAPPVAVTPQSAPATGTH